MIKGILFDLGDTLIRQKVDLAAPLSDLELVPFPDAQPALEALKAEGYIIGILSNTHQSTGAHVAKALENLNLRNYFDVIVTSIDVGVEKPAPAMFLAALERLRLPPHEVAMVGDDILKDIAGANNIGLTTVLLVRNGTMREYPDANFVVSTLSEVAPILKAYQGSAKEQYPSATKSQLDILEHSAQFAQEEKRWQDAGRLYIKAAEQCLQSQLYETASDYFMRAARCNEQSETWRETGELWVRAAAALEQMKGEESLRLYSEYTDTDQTTHYFSGFPVQMWDKIPIDDRIGRAYRYAGYHLEQGGTNQSAYVQYEQAAQAFVATGDFDQANRALYLAVISFVRKFGELNEQHIQRFETVNRQLLSKDTMKYLSRNRIYYSRIAAELAAQGNQIDQDKMLIQQREISRIIARRRKKIHQWLAYSLWRVTSHYGTDFRRWLLWATLIAVGIFPTLYSLFSLLTPAPYDWLDSLHFSIAAFVTTNYVNLVPAGWGRLIALAETLIGLFMLGSLLSMVISRIAR